MKEMSNKTWFHPNLRLVVVGSTLADLRREVVRCANTGPGQLHGAARPQVQTQHRHAIKSHRNVESLLIFISMRWPLPCMYVKNQASKQKPQPAAHRNSWQVRYRQANRNTPVALHLNRIPNVHLGFLLDGNVSFISVNTNCLSTPNWECNLFKPTGKRARYEARRTPLSKINVFAGT